MKTKPNPVLFSILSAALLILVNCNKEEEQPTEIILPTVITLPATEVTSSSAESGGEITIEGNDNITSRGIVWDTNPDPTIENNNGQTSDGSGSGLFRSDLSDLQPNTEYYLRAYATNSGGTAYGDQESFITSPDTWPRDSITAIVEVINPATGKIWMDRNLGASRAATSGNDPESFGHLYQWGRAADGHQVRTSNITSTLSNSDVPGHGDFIISSFDSHWDWRSDQNHNLWQGSNGINNPCPQGYRVPTSAEWEWERNSWGTNNNKGAFDSPLKLPEAGSRSYRTGSVQLAGYSGYYWSSTKGTSTMPWYNPAGDNGSFFLAFDQMDALMFSEYRANGYSVRCIKD